MIVSDIRKLLDCRVQFRLCFILMLIDQFVFQRVEIPLHWRIVVWTPCFAHALCDGHVLTVFHEILRCVLASLIRMQDQYAFYRRL